MKTWVKIREGESLNETLRCFKMGPSPKILKRHMLLAQCVIKGVVTALYFKRQFLLGIFITFIFWYWVCCYLRDRSNSKSVLLIYCFVLNASNVVVFCCFCCCCCPQFVWGFPDASLIILYKYFHFLAFGFNICTIIRSTKPNLP